MKLRIGGKTLNPALIAVLALLVLIPLIFLRFSYGVMICCFIEIYVIAVSGFHDTLCVQNTVFIQNNKAGCSSMMAYDLLFSCFFWYGSCAILGS